MPIIIPGTIHQQILRTFCRRRHFHPHSWMEHTHTAYSCGAVSPALRALFNTHAASKALSPRAREALPMKEEEESRQDAAAAAITICIILLASSVMPSEHFFSISPAEAAAVRRGERERERGGHKTPLTQTMQTHKSCAPDLFRRQIPIELQIYFVSESPRSPVLPPSKGRGRGGGDGKVKERNFFLRIRHPSVVHI